MRKVLAAGWVAVVLLAFSAAVLIPAGEARANDGPTVGDLTVTGAPLSTLPPPVPASALVKITSVGEGGNTRYFINFTVNGTAPIFKASDIAVRAHLNTGGWVTKPANPWYGVDGAQVPGTVVTGLYTSEYVPSDYDRIELTYLGTTTTHALPVTPAPAPVTVAPPVAPPVAAPAPAPAPVTIAPPVAAPAPPAAPVAAPAPAAPACVARTLGTRTLATIRRTSPRVLTIRAHTDYWTGAGWQPAPPEDYTLTLQRKVGTRWAGVAHVRPTRLLPTDAPARAIGPRGIYRVVFPGACNLPAAASATAAVTR